MLYNIFYLFKKHFQSSWESKAKFFCTFDRKEKPIKQNLNEKAIFKNRDSGRRIGRAAQRHGTSRHSDAYYPANIYHPQSRLQTQPLHRHDASKLDWRSEYLLSGAFTYIRTLDDPMYFPKQLDKTYPNNEGQVPTAKLEGFCRTLFVAAPLLREKPELTLNGIKVADYYRHQLLNLIRPDSPSFILTVRGGRARYWWNSALWPYHCLWPRTSFGNRSRKSKKTNWPPRC